MIAQICLGLTFHLEVVSLKLSMSQHPRCIIDPQLSPYSIDYTRNVHRCPMLLFTGRDGVLQTMVWPLLWVVCVTSALAREVPLVTEPRPGEEYVNLHTSDGTTAAAHDDNGMVEFVQQVNNLS